MALGDEAGKSVLSTLASCLHTRRLVLFKGLIMVQVRDR